MDRDWTENGPRMNMALIKKKNFNSRDLVKKYDQTYFNQEEKPVIKSDPLPESFFEDKKTDDITDKWRWAEKEKEEKEFQTKLFY